MFSILEQLHRSTPLTDKVLAVIGVAASGTLTMGTLQAGMGIFVGALTALILIPRVILAWRDLMRRLRNAEAREEEEREE